MNDRCRNKQSNRKSYDELSRSHHSSIKLEKEILQAYTLSTDGRAISRTDDGVVTFIKNMLPNEKAKVEILQKKSSYKIATLVKLETQSPDRVTPPCPYVESCGGCQLQHINELMQTQYKVQWFLETLKRIGKWNEENIWLIQKILAVVYLKKKHYRRRVRFHYNGKNFGFKENNSNKIVQIDNCYITNENINAKLKSIKENLDKSFREIIEKKISKNFECEIEITESDDEKIILNVANINIDDLAQKSASLNIIEKNLSIQDEQSIYISHPDIPRFKLKKHSFIQPHHDCISSYYSYMKDSVDDFIQKEIKFKNKFIAWDLYAGSGTFTSLPVYSAAKFKAEVECVGVEGIKEAVESLRANCKNLGVQSVCVPVEEFIDSEFSKKSSSLKNYNLVDIVILDPPRSGVGIETIQKLIELCSKRALVLLLACDPACFARDTRLLLLAGFHPKNVTLFDSFAHTTHYEILGCFERGF